MEANAFLDYLNDSPATSALAESLAALVDTRRASHTRHRVRRPARGLELTEKTAANEPEIPT